MPGIVGGRPIRVGDPNDPREEIGLSHDEAMLVRVGLSSYRKAVEDHASEDNFEAHTREEVDYLQAQVDLLIAELTPCSCVFAAAVQGTRSGTSRRDETHSANAFTAADRLT